MKTLQTYFSILLLAVFCATTAQAEPFQTRLTTTEEIVIPGVVDRVLAGQEMVRLKTEYGALVEVPKDTLGVFTGGDAGYQELEEGLRVSARIHPGQLSFAPASQGRIWLLVDGEQLVRLYAKDIDDDLFLHDEREAKYNGRVDDVSLSAVLKDEMTRLEVMSW